MAKPTYLETVKLLGLQPQQLALLDRFLDGNTATDFNATMSVLQCAAAAVFKRINCDWQMSESTALTFVLLAKPVLVEYAAYFNRSQSNAKPVCTLAVHDQRYIVLTLYGPFMATGFFDARADVPGLIEKLPEHCEVIEITDLSVMLLRFFGRLKAYRKPEKSDASNDVTANPVSGTDGKSRVVRHDITGAPD